MHDARSIEGRARNPTKGLRLRLRTELRRLGVVGKFRTDELRGGSLVVLTCGAFTTIPLTMFEGRNVSVRQREKSDEPIKIEDYRFPGEYTTR